MNVEQTPSEFFETLTGFDEIAIKQAFSQPIAALQDDPFMFLRALIFVHRRREGSKDSAARTEALGMVVKDVSDYFEEEVDEPVPDEPRSESGKDSEPFE